MGCSGGKLICICPLGRPIIAIRNNRNQNSRRIGKKVYCLTGANKHYLMCHDEPKNLQDYLVRAKLRPLCINNQGNKGVVRCDSTRCDVCNCAVPGSSFTSHTTKRSYAINYQLDCNSYNVVYLITCKVCGLQYVGSNSTKFRLRFNNHKRRLRGHSSKSTDDRECDDFIYKHFHSPGHHRLPDVSVQIIDKVNTKDKLATSGPLFNTGHRGRLNEIAFFIITFFL